MPIFRVGDRLHYFAHVPKCGGSSIERYLRGRFGALAFVDSRHLDRPAALRWSRSSPQHLALSDFRRLVPSEWISSSFAVVRHPQNRLVSAFRFQVEVERSIAAIWTIDEWFDDWLETAASNPYQYDGHLRPQSDLIPADATVFRLEDGLDAIVPYLDGLAGSNDGPRTVAASNIRKAVDGPSASQDKPSASTLEKISTYYAEDFRRFGYDPEQTEWRSQVGAQPKSLLKRMATKLGTR